MTSKKFTIVYKTYFNDLEWLKYSLLSLQKYLDFTNIYEIIIYLHDKVTNNLTYLLDNIKMNNFITCRTIPVHYGYHGYIKQMAVKLNCYKDCSTDYIVLLDCDLLLKKSLNFDYFIKKDGKIEWYYLNKMDDPNNEVFTVWKKACEDATFQIKNVHYMSNGFPFVFTRKSLEDADKKFMQMHNCNYDYYCRQRCLHLNISVNAKITDAFAKLSQIFTEFEYIGFYCRNFSDEYTFINTKKCLMEKQHNNDDPNSFFIQNWSHGGITQSTRDKINAILA